MGIWRVLIGKKRLPRSPPHLPGWHRCLIGRHRSPLEPLPMLPPAFRQERVLVLIYSGGGLFIHLGPDAGNIPVPPTPHSPRFTFKHPLPSQLDVPGHSPKLQCKDSLAHQVQHDANLGRQRLSAIPSRTRTKVLPNTNAYQVPDLNRHKVYPPEAYTSNIPNGGSELSLPTAGSFPALWRTFLG